MEVHHHPDLHHQPKKWKEYFLEFLMIFLAVTMGFFAEQIRESFVEHNHEKVYIQSFYEDLSQDQKNLPALSDWIQMDINVSDSLKLLLKNVTLKTKANDIYVDFRFLIRQLGIKNFVNQRTIFQLRNTGEWRLIRNKQVNDSILEYYKNVETIAALQEYSLMQKGKLRDLYAPLLKSDDWDKVTEKNSDNIIHPHDNLYLKSVNPDVINNCLLEISDIKGIHKGFKNQVIDLRNEATRLKKLIAQHYRVKQ
ncbi:MAG TPA: hypothetical protein VFQ86_07050 [Arachidicoccus soli]|uniref:Uncharacterized protein n=1 Tax=Arachidicoccus soli TaxID=2341117 RepID=A0A386HNP6_9BACT|nr:hypothetical protein [Arachidicoccus soli]AYD47548.1 hypothetical protein D6B99_07995 [Arachidicoccus soli]HEU0227477.1 hypothetical protein [Arachidicoccus soli]